MFPCVALLIMSLVRSSSSLSTSLYTALEVRADSLTFLPARDSRARGDVMQCGLSCSSQQDCPAFSYSASDKLCTRLEVSLAVQLQSLVVSVLYYTGGLYSY